MRSTWTRIVRIIGIAGAGGGIILLMLMTVVDVTARKIGTPFMGVFELSKLVLVIVVFLGLTYTQLQERHVSVNLFTSRISTGLQVKLKITVLFISVLFWIIMAWYTIQATIYAYRLDVIWLELPFSFPIWIVRAVLPLGCILLSIELIFEAIKQLAILRSTNLKTI
jgi:TRAP-type C4-dicarboxylate transport system permease small subunit